MSTLWFRRAGSTEGAASVVVRLTGRGGVAHAHVVIEAQPHSRGTVILRHEGTAQQAQNVEIIVRDGAALTLLKAWNTGHPGGIATVHANSAIAALYRIEQLCQETVVTVPRQLIAEAIDIIVFISGRGAGRRIETIARVGGLEGVDLSDWPALRRIVTAVALRLRGDHTLTAEETAGVRKRVVKRAAKLLGAELRS